MRNILIMLAILGGSFGICLICGGAVTAAARGAVSALFVFTALGHFAKPGEMLEMIPPWVPSRKLIVFLSGIFELLLAVGISTPATSRYSSLAAIAFLLLATPLNVYSAYHRVPFGGHASGPKYLLVRLPLQAILIAWIYGLCLRVQ